MRRTKRALTDGELRRLAVPQPQPGRKRARKVYIAGGVPGLRYQVQETGRRDFLLRYTFAGVRKSVAIGQHGAKLPALTAEQARRRAGEILSELRKGVDPLAVRKAARVAAAAQQANDRADAERRRALARGEALPGSFAALARLYLADPGRSTQRKESRRAFVSVIELDLIPAWGAKPAGSIDRGEVYALGSAIAAGAGARRRRPGQPAPVAAATAMKLASSIFNFGLDVGFPGLVGNPCTRVLRRIAPTRERRDRWLSPAEIRALWQATEVERPVLRAFARLLLLTALRRDELLGARWAEISEDERGTWLAIPAERMKAGRAVRVPFSSLARAELAQLGEARDPVFLFPGRSAGTALREVYYYRKRLRERMAPALAGEEADPRVWTWHDLRRTARSILAAEGVSDTVAELLLAHIPVGLRGTAGTYNRHDYAAEKLAAVEALARRVRAIVAPESEPTEDEPDNVLRPEFGQRAGGGARP